MERILARLSRWLMIVFFYILSLLYPAWGQNSDQWSMFRGDPALSGYSEAKLKFPLELKWSYETGDAIVAAPVIGDQTIFVSSIDGIVSAVDFLGSLKWQFEAENSIEAPAMLLRGRLYVGDFSGFLYALDAADGNLIWQYETGNQIMGSPSFAMVKNRLYILVGSYDYYLHCIDAESGKNVWKYESDNFINGAPAIIDGMAMFGGCDGFLHMVDLETGMAAKKLEVATYIAGSVCIYQGKAYTGDYDGLFTCIDLKQQSIYWQFDNPTSNLPILASPAVSENKVVIGGQDKYLRCFDDKGVELWNFNAGGRIDASPIIVRNVVVTATMDGFIYALNIKNGKEIWQYEIGSAIAHNPAVVEGKLVVGARDGFLYCFEK
jgi:outer membrane protein assembly factor BamB